MVPDMTMLTILPLEFQLAASARSLLRQLKGQDPVVSDLFDRGRMCFGEQDYTILIERGLIQESDIHTLNALYQQYCLANVELKQVEKVRNQLRKCQEEPNESERAMDKGKLASLLQQKRHYAMENNPYAFAMLLVEDEMGIVCDENQVKHFIDMVLNRSSFKHEAWGGGKTTVLRHLITKFHANGQNLSSLLTHAPLKKEHHRNLKESTAAVYGQQAFDTDFSRSSPTDGIALRRQYLTLVKAVEERGRTDQTMNSLLSLRHAYHLKLIGLNPETDSAALRDEVSVFNQMRQFRQERMVVGSDELDQLFTPDREHNYAIGTPVQLDKQLYQPAFDILEALSKFPESAFFTTEGLNPKDIPLEQRQQLLARLADAMIEKYQFADIDPALLKRYWLTPANKDSTPSEYQSAMHFYNAQVVGHRDAHLLQMLYVYFNSIIPSSFDNSCGVTYGRSKDGVHTKPCSNSGDPSESSQHGSLPMLVWYSCLDYWKEGVNEKTVETYVIHLKEKARREQLGVNPLFLDETAVGRKFEASFHVKLSQISKNDYAGVAGVINGGIDLKVDCLRVANFEKMKVAPRRLKGNGKLAAHDVREIWGCSGNSERARTLPAKVKLVDPELIRQKGTMGRIFYNLISDFKPEDVIEYNAVNHGVPVAFIAEKLRRGMALVDIGPFLQGLKPEQCVDKIMPLMPDQIPIRYINSEGQITVRLTDGRDVPYATHPVASAECVTLFTHKDRRGQDLPLSPVGSHLMTLSSDTSLTDFSQGGMRARLWGKGQKYQYIQDESLKQAIAAKPYLQGLKTPVQMMALLIENEVQRIQHLDTVANKQEVNAVGDAAVQQMLQSTDNPQALMALTRLVSLDQNAEFNLQELSRPVQAVTGYQGIQVSIQKERRQLEDLLVAIQAEPLFENKLGIYETIIRHALANLNDKMILEPKYLLPFTTAADEHGTVEEIEVAQEMAVEEAAVEQAVEQEFQVETEVDIEQQQRIEIETEEEREEPREYNAHSHFPLSSFFPDELQDLCKFMSSLPNPGSFCTWRYATDWEHNLWINGQLPKHRQLLAPSILLVVDTQTKNVNSVLGTVKDADTNFENYPSKHRDNTSFVCMHYKFDDQRAMDEVLKTVPQECRADAMKHIVFAKLCYAVDCHFTKEEIPVLKELWATLPDHAKNALPTYLRRYFPEDSRPILQHLEI